MHNIPSRPVKLRLYYLDWIRVLAFGLLLFYHIALIFVDWDFHIKNSELYNGLKLPMLFIRQWRMPLLFLISGAGSWFAIKNIRNGAFIKKRIIRLLIPLIFGFLVITPLLNYVGLLHKGATYGSYASFMENHFFHHFRWNHLWFIGYLLVYTILALPLFHYLRGTNGKKLAEKTAMFFSAKKYSLLLLVIPLFIIEYTLRDAWPDKRKLINDWYNFSFYFVTLIYGYFIASNMSIWDRIEDDRTFYFLLGAVCFIFIYTELHQSGDDFLEKSYDAGVIYKLVKSVNTLAWMFCFLGYAKQYLNFTSRPMRYANMAVYPFYILHQPVLIIIGFFAVQLDIGIFAKYILISMGTFLFIWLFFEFVIRRSRWAALFFGVKERDLTRDKAHNVISKLFVN